MKRIVSALLSLVLALTLCAALGEEETAKGLVAYYDFEDPENLGKDVSGNGNDLAPVGKGKIAASEDAAVGTYALDLDGDAALAGDVYVGDYTDSLVDYTISFYARHQGFAGEHSRVFSTGYNGIQAGLCMVVAKYAYNGTEHIIFQPIIGDPQRDFWGRINDKTLFTEKLDEYHWYVCSFDHETKTVTAWVDGKLCGSVECVEPTVACDPFGVAIGASYAPWETNVMYGFIGKVDDLRVYNYAIEDISEIYGE